MIIIYNSPSKQGIYAEEVGRNVTEETYNKEGL